jgi:putative transposase
MKTVAGTIGGGRCNLAVQAAAVAPQRRGRRPQPDAALLAEIKDLIADLPSYGYRRVHALLRRHREQSGEAAENVKRVYHEMKAHGLLLARHFTNCRERHHDGRVGVDQPDTRWCSDSFEIGCDNGERVRIAFILD